jgi:hypothetical protein
MDLHQCNLPNLWIRLARPIDYLIVCGFETGHSLNRGDA